jgi:hypothetical protein
MRNHKIDQLTVAPLGIIEPEFIVGRTLAAHKIARRHRHGM